MINGPKMFKREAAWSRWVSVVEGVPSCCVTLMSRARDSLLRLTNEVRRQIGIACAFVHGHLRIGAQWPTHVHPVIVHTIRRNLIRSLAVFAPCFHGGDDSKLI